MIDPNFAAWYEPRRLKFVEEDPTTSYVLARLVGEVVREAFPRVCPDALRTAI